MGKDKIDILVYAHWYWLDKPIYVGILSGHKGRGTVAFSFEYDKHWLEVYPNLLLDPQLANYAGKQFPSDNQIFGVFQDTQPDTWGRTLMKRRAALQHESSFLSEVDLLLGVYDKSRMGALRFKLDKDGPFLDDNPDYPTPPWSSIRDLQYATTQIESDNESADIAQWLAILMAPGSSLGGARPKANILDEKGQLWIAKFPSKNDTYDMAKWEYLAYKLALDAGVNMSETMIQKVSGQYYTFFTKRFDRKQEERIHFSSAMTMTGNSEVPIRDNSPSYLEIAEFIQFAGANVKSDLEQLWRRIVFNIAISNTDDHLRNHGFILTPKGWVLSPAYDINPSTEKNGLSLNIDMESNALDFDLAMSVGKYFQLDMEQMNSIIEKVSRSVSNWQKIAVEIGISRKEQELMAGAFKF